MSGLITIYRIIETNAAGEKIPNAIDSFIWDSEEIASFYLTMIHFTFNHRISLYTRSDRRYAKVVTDEVSQETYESQRWSGRTAQEDLASEKEWSKR